MIGAHQVAMLGMQRGGGGDYPTKFLDTFSSDTDDLRSTPRVPDVGEYADIACITNNNTVQRISSGMFLPATGNIANGTVFLYPKLRPVQNTVDDFLSIHFKLGPSWPVISGQPIFGTYLRYLDANNFFYTSIARGSSDGYWPRVGMVVNGATILAGNYWNFNIGNLSNTSAKVFRWVECAYVGMPSTSPILQAQYWDGSSWVNLYCYRVLKSEISQAAFDALITWPRLIGVYYNLPKSVSTGHVDWVGMECGRSLSLGPIIND